MRIKIIVLALLAVTAGVFSYTRPHNGVPSDLRDAVSDGAFDALKNKSGAEASDAKVPEPEVKPFYKDMDPAGVIGAIKVPDATISKPADTGQTSKGFFGNGDRRVVNSAEKPYRLVGNLLESGNRICTAFLISDQVAMTAAHCVKKPGDYQFKYDGGGPWREASARWRKVNIVSISLAKNYTGDAVSDNIILEDFALLKLEEPSPEGWGYFRIADHVAVGQAALAIGFPRVLGDTNYKIVSDNCSIRKLAEDSIYSDCAINRGNSGGPLLVKDDNDEWLLAGVTSTQKIFSDGNSAMGEAYRDDIANHFCNVTLYKARITHSLAR